MVFGKQDRILDRLDALERRLAAIEAALINLDEAAALRAETDRQREQLAALGEQGLHVVELLDDARRELRELRDRD